jgi:hypothetical protein
MKRRLKIFTIVILLFAAVLPLSCAKRSGIARTKYTISATYDGENTLTACANIDYYNSTGATLDELYFHLYPAAYRKNAQFKPIDESYVSLAYPVGENWGGIAVGKTSVRGVETQFEIGGEDEDILIVPLLKEISPGERAQISVEYTLTLATVKHRTGKYDGVATFGNWYPIACVYESGEFDTSPYYSNGDPFYSEVADYEVSVTVPSTLVVATSGTAERVENGVSATYSSTLTARDFAFCVGEFKVDKREEKGVVVLYYYRKDVDHEGTVKAAADALKFFSDKFGAYPYSTYSVVEAPFLYGGMEYPTLSIVSDSLSKSLTQEATIHETAHQWWYGLVGNDEIRHAWMDEGLAEYSTTVFYEFNPSYGVTYKARMADATSAYIVYSDVSDSDGKMDKKLNEFSSYDYTYLTYLKGALLFDAVRKTLGDRAFFKSLAEYCSRYSFRNAAPDDLISTLSTVSKTDLRGLFNGFLEGKTRIFTA